MAIGALCRAVVRDREPSMIESSACPRRRSMASRARGRETRRRMVGIGGPVIVRLVTRVAIRRRSRKHVVNVATRTGNRGMRTGQRERRAVMECQAGSRPIGGGVADRAIGRKTCGHVVGIGRSREVGLMTAIARRVGAGQAVVVIDVALGALQRGVRTGQRKARAGVVERCSRPTGGGVALRAIGGEAARHVVGIRGACEVGLMAAIARRVGAGQAVVAIDVALLALQRGVRASQGEAGGRVIERRARPGSVVVALQAVGGEPCLNVIGIRRTVVVRLMASDARGVGAGQIVIPVHVALLALQRRVRAREREAGGRVVKRGVAPRSRRVALLAGGREAGLHVIGIRRAVEVGLMAGDASRVGAGQIVIAVHVALLALHRRVRAGQREAGGRVIERRGAPRRGVVALLAGGGEAGLHVVRIRRFVEIRLMAGHASCIGAGQVVVVVDVALLALHRRVRTGQREARCRMVKGSARPRRGVVALLARGGEPRLHVVGVGRIVEVRLMAGNASRVGAGQIVVVVNVALRALQRGVRAGQREAGRRVIERGTRPRRGVVALLTRGGES